MNDSSTVMSVFHFELAAILKRDLRFFKYAP